MAHVHLLLGPVGAGKSTYARSLAQTEKAVSFDLDDWMARLFGADERPKEGRIEWYLERRDRVLEQIWSTAEQIIDRGSDVIIEVGLIQKTERSAFFPRLDDCGHEYTLHVLDASRDIRRQRVQRRNQERTGTFSMIVPPEIFELASDMWQPLSADEREGRVVLDMNTAPAG